MADQHTRLDGWVVAMEMVDSLNDLLSSPGEYLLGKND